MAVNGIPGIARARSIQPSKSPTPAKVFSEVDGQGRRDLPFPESSAIVRTPAGMTTFNQLDRELDERLASMKLENGFGGWGASLEERLKSYAGDVEEDEVDGDGDVVMNDGDVGEKRKL